MRKQIIAVDFDGTLCESKFPGIGEPKWELIELLKKYRQDNILILWTCRAGKDLDDAIWWCGEHGLQFDYVNENTRENLEKYGGRDNRKIYADLYIDDKSAHPSSLGKIEDILD